MRISEDSASWKAGGALRRDFRHTHHGPEVARHRRRNKDTLRWCGGKVGRDHVIGTVPDRWRNELEEDPDTGETRNVRVVYIYRTECVRCGRADITRFEDHVRAAWDEQFAAHLTAAALWCDRGHLYDAIEVGRWWTRTIKICVMCGHAPDDRCGYRTVNPPSAL